MKDRVNMWVQGLQRFVLGITAAVLPGALALASPVTFTWDPSQATPALTSGPAAFSADTLSLTNYIRGTNTNNLTTLKQTSVGTQYQTINGFTLGGAAVNAPGFNSTYGLYFRIDFGVLFPINAAGAYVGPGVYQQLDIQLVADVGHDDGSVQVNSAGIGFSNPSGVGNDVVLANGSLLSASLAMNANGSRNAHYSTTFKPVPGEAGFFKGTGVDSSLDIILNTAASAFQLVPVDTLTVLNVVGADGNSTGTGQLVPEPASLALLVAGCFGIGICRRLGSGYAAARPSPM